MDTASRNAPHYLLTFSFPPSSPISFLLPRTRRLSLISSSRSRIHIILQSFRFFQSNVYVLFFFFPKMKFSVAALLSVVSVVSAETFTVLVGENGGLTYNPTSVNASVGDTIAFQFVAKNHTVTQSTFANPCTASGVDSGFFPVTANATQIPEWSFTLNNDSAPLWFFCAQTGHCEKGMVFAVNPTAAKSFDAFQAAAMASTGTTGTNTTSASGASSASGAATTGSSTATDVAGAAASASGTATSSALPRLSINGAAGLLSFGLLASLVL
ncbi:serine-threonine rich [Pyrrhoderma noxium]|uniref:Serine-threonine rich n=1 Tax=Pyrrhoderma noxium TaxID=2282107 RepID=A0A286UVA5_9AGAM|nr:serine-threonine rich [Pyrrhoderma noxium]